MNESKHQVLRDMLGAYAMHAATKEETLVLDDHLASCPACQRILDQYREVLAILATSSANVPESVWNGIKEKIETQVQRENLTQTKAIPPLKLIAQKNKAYSQIGARRLSRPHLIRSLAASIFLLVIFAFSFMSYDISTLNNKVNSLQAQLQSQTAMSLAQSALASPQTKKIQLYAPNSRTKNLGVIAVAPSGEAFLVGTKMKTLSADKTYQLWGVKNNSAISLGVVGRNPRDDLFFINPEANYKEIAITVESAPGVVTSTNVPVAVAGL